MPKALSMKRTIQFTVEGNLSFPTDMLRYDNCTYKTDVDSMVAMLHGKRRVTLCLEVNIRYVRPSAFPSTGRWESFGWKVIDRKEL